MNIKSNIFTLYIIMAALCITAVICAEYGARKAEHSKSKHSKQKEDSLRRQIDSVSKSFIINHSEIK